MSQMHRDYGLDLVQMEHRERLRAAEARRLVRAARPPSPVRRRFGSGLIRLGLLVGGSALARSPWLVPAHPGGAAR